MKIEFQNSIARLSFLCRITDIKIAWINPRTVPHNPSIMIYVNKMENTITVKIKTAYYPELLRPEKMKLLGSSKSKITKDENGENMSHLRIAEVVLMHCNTVSNDCQDDSRVLYTFAPNKSFGQLLNISLKHFIFLKTFQNFHIFKYGLLIKILNQ